MGFVAALDHKFYIARDFWQSQLEDIISTRTTFYNNALIPGTNSSTMLHSLGQLTTLPSSEESCWWHRAEFLICHFAPFTSEAEEQQAPSCESNWKLLIITRAIIITLQQLLYPGLAVPLLVGWAHGGKMLIKIMDSLTNWWLWVQQESLFTPIQKRK